MDPINRKPVPARPLRILQVTPAMQGGGGEQIAVRLHREFLRRSHRSMLFVGRAVASQEVGAFAIPSRMDVTAWARTMRKAELLSARITGGRGRTRLTKFFEALAYPRVPWDLALGREDFTQPGSRRLLELAPEPPDVVLLHNLHARWNRREGFFDLDWLPALSRAVPVVIYPQDPWLTTGHCAHPINCLRWRVGCGQCPDLDIYPSIRCDSTAWNFRRKRRLFAESQVHLTAPSQWLLDRFVEAGIPLAGSYLVPNGVDPDLFTPGDKFEARRSLGLLPDRAVILLSGNHLRTNPWKGFAWMVEAAKIIGSLQDLPPVDFLCVGDEGPSEDLGNARILFAGRAADSAGMPVFYQAADIYLHPSKADTAPFSVLEAMASGLPVVATSVGGIPEQVSESTSGWLTAPGDVAALAGRLAGLLADHPKAAAMGAEGRRSVLARFTLARQVDALLDVLAQAARRI